jgi:hypothetical protein
MFSGAAFLLVFSAAPASRSAQPQRFAAPELIERQAPPIERLALFVCEIVNVIMFRGPLSA